jgi:hypothetical protein
MVNYKLKLHHTIGSTTYEWVQRIKEVFDERDTHTKKTLNDALKFNTRTTIQLQRSYTFSCYVIKLIQI